jgi:hypothetical protein
MQHASSRPITHYRPGATSRTVYLLTITPNPLLQFDIAFPPFHGLEREFIRSTTGRHNEDFNLQRRGALLRLLRWDTLQYHKEVVT